MDKETTKQKKTIDSYDELLERYIGVAGSEERKEFEEELDREVELYALGQSIKDARLSKQLTQEQLGELVGVKRAQICRWEKGRSLAIPTLHKVFKALGIHINIQTELGIYPIA